MYLAGKHEKYVLNGSTYNAYLPTKVMYTCLLMKAKILCKTKLLLLLNGQ